MPNVNAGYHRSLAALVALCLSLLPLAAGAQVESLARKAPSARPGDPNRCPEGSSVLVEVQGIRLLVPRSPRISATLGDGSILGLGRASKTYTCSTPEITGVKGLSSREYTIGEPASRAESREKFESLRVLVLDVNASKRTIFEKLPDGVSRLTHPSAAYEILLLPEDEAPTGDGEPVALFCANAVKGKLAEVVPQPCKAFYIHPSGLRFSYMVLRAELPDDKILETELKKRKILDDMIEGAKKIPARAPG